MTAAMSIGVAIVDQEEHSEYEPGRFCDVDCGCDACEVGFIAAAIECGLWPDDNDVSTDSTSVQTTLSEDEDSGESDETGFVDQEEHSEYEPGRFCDVDCGCDVCEIGFIAAAIECGLWPDDNDVSTDSISV
jgi:hypothetical protein